MSLDIQKKNRIAAMKDEKKELHPLLNMLLRNLPDVKTVEYTHGVNEMGADFIYSKLDTVLDTLYYGAVVAKVGRLGFIYRNFLHHRFVADHPAY